MIHGGCDVNSQDVDGNTALHWAAWFRLENLVPQLLQHGASPEVPNISGETAVHWAARASNTHSLEAMTAGNRGLLSRRDCDGFTPFVILAQNDNAPVMEWMYLRGISVEEQDNLGRTALHWACYKGHRKAVQWLLSRGANIAHRDHEGMTAIHWSALKGHEQVSDMLIDVGAAHLLASPDATGETPVTLAMRKRHRQMVLGFLKCQLFLFLIGRPIISRNHLANFFMAFVAMNVAVYFSIILPGIAAKSPGPSVIWLLLIAATMFIWRSAVRSDPGWLTERTIFPQGEDVSFDDPSGAYDMDIPVESQLAGVHNKGYHEASTSLTRLELEQAKYSYQRQLINKARQKLQDEGFCGTLTEERSVRGVELVPLMDLQAHHDQQQQQLDRASSELEQRAMQTSDSLGWRRTQHLLDLGREEYVELLNKGQYKQICVVCRVQREVRSHHCKECGRCVRRLDHHCPWIDNCVGLRNQRSFFCFIVILLCTILYFHYVSILYVLDSIVPFWVSGEATRTLMSISRWRLGPELRPLLVLLTCAFDVAWLAFVAALVARHLAYMAVNITTFEVLIRPPHVQRRFPHSSGRFWFLHKCNVFDSVRNCFNYWTLNSEEELVAYTSADGHVPAAAKVQGSEDTPGRIQGISSSRAEPMPSAGAEMS